MTLPSLVCFFRFLSHHFPTQLISRLALLIDDLHSDPMLLCLYAFASDTPSRIKTCLFPLPYLDLINSLLVEIVLILQDIGSGG